MIELTDLNNQNYILNSDLIERIESVPYTKILLTNGKKYLVKESVDEVVDKVMNYKKKTPHLQFLMLKK
jgi:flagellar protein FlbD